MVFSHLLSLSRNLCLKLASYNHLNHLSGKTAQGMIMSFFFLLRTKGSHFFLTLPDQPMKSTVVQNTPKDIPVGTLLAIQKQLRITRKEFIELIS